MLDRLRRMEPEKLLFLAGWLVAFAGLLFALLLYRFPGLGHLPGSSTTCILYTVTGYYCPGCGGTRAARYLLTGHLLKSLWSNCFVTYLLLYYGFFMVSHTAAVVTKNRIRGMRFRKWHIYVGVVLLLLQFVMKNVLLIFWNIRMI